MKHLTRKENLIIRKQYGAQARPILHADKSIEGLIRANCQRKSRVLAREIIKQLLP